MINPSGSSGWSGYFKGVKNRLVFLDAADGGLLGVYDSGTGKKVFEDVAYDASIWNVSTEKSTAFDHLWVGQVEDGTYLLRYLRAVDADCDLYRERETCWLSVKKKFGLKNTPIPTCFGYAEISDRWVSMIAYPVEVSLKLGSNQAPVVKNVDGQAKCWPVE